MSVLISIFIYFVVPIFVLYFIVQAAVRNAIDSSEVGRIIKENHYGKSSKK